jgi:antitoxin VapB
MQKVNYTEYTFCIWGLILVQTRVFKSNKSQAVRLPKAVEMPENIKDVDVVAVGNTRIISPAGKAWDEWFDAEGISDDFMESRLQPETQEGESF